MFPGKSKTSHIEGFIEEPIKLSVRKWDGMLFKTDCRINIGNLKLLFSVILRLSGVEKDYLTRKLPKRCRFSCIKFILSFRGLVVSPSKVCSDLDAF